MPIRVRYYIQCDAPGCGGKTAFLYELGRNVLGDAGLPDGWSYSTGDAESDAEPERLRVFCSLHSRPKKPKPDTASKKKAAKKSSGGDAPPR